MTVKALETDTSLPLVCPLMRSLFRPAVSLWKWHLESLSSTSDTPRFTRHPPPVPSYSPNPQFSPFLFRLEQATSASLRVLVFLRKHQILARFPDAVSSSSYQLLSDHKTRPEQSSPQKALLSPK